MINPWSLRDSNLPPKEVTGWSARLTWPRVAALSFLGMVIVGTVGLLVGPGFYTGARLGLVDALFTATSAVCVTGLVVADTGTAFTPLGQAWIAAMIQAGGLGILTFTTAFAVAAGKKGRLVVEEAAGAGSLYSAQSSRRSLFRSILALTLLIEGAGALGLWFFWREGLGPGPAVGAAVFHAISAFCNAGFSTFSDSLVGQRGAPQVLGLVMTLVVVGGIGFVVLEDVRAKLGFRGRVALTLHSKLVLAVTGIMILLSWIMFAAFEWGGQLHGLGFWDRILNALFMAVTPRTAGFNTIDYLSAENPSVFLTMLLMIIGGSPGSTAGGVKTVSLGILVLVLLARIRGDARVSAFGRTLPRETIQRAVGLVVGGLILLASAVFLLLISEAPGGDPRAREEFVSLAFEATSAFGTVGLSMGATPMLSGVGKLIIVGLMFAGRLGPLVLVATMTPREPSIKGTYRYGEEDVVIG